MSDPSSAQPGPDPAALESILFACLDAAPADQENALAAACQQHPQFAESLRRAWQRIRQLQPGTAVGAPTQLAGFRIVRRLGGGGMGVVYLAEQERLHRKVALKLIRSDLVDSAAARERFQREAIAASKVEHPGLCPVFEVGEADGVPFLVMPYLEGMTLAARLDELAAQRPAKAGLSLAGRDLVAVMAAVARAAHHAHEHGLVHRDIKPGNIMLLPDGRPVLLDFGLARDLVSGDATLTKSGERVGTPAYMAPEQLRGERDVVDRRTDVYALGVVLYEVATLERAFVADDLLALREQIASGVRPGRLRGRVPYDLASIVLKAADPEPVRRYYTAAALADDLERFLRLEPVTARRLGSVGRAVRWARRYPVIAGLLVALAVALGFAGAALNRSMQEQRRFQSLALQGDSRNAERTDARLAVDMAMAADELDPTPRSLMQLNRAVAVRRELHRWQLASSLRWVGFTADRRRVLAVTLAGTMHVFDVASRTEIAQLPAPTRGLAVSFVSAAAENTVLVFGGTGTDAFVWRPSHGECKALTGAHEDRVLAAAVAGDGTMFTGDAKGRVVRWGADGVPSGAVPWRVVEGAALELAVGNDRLVIGGEKQLTLAPLAEGDAEVLPTKGPAILLSVSAATRRLFAARLGVYGMFDLDGKHMDVFGPELRYFGGHLDARGQRLAIAHRGSMRVYNLEQVGDGLAGLDRASYRDAPVGGGPVGLVRFTDDGSRLFAMSEDNVLRMFDADGESLLALPDFAKLVRSLAYDPATVLLVTGDDTGCVRLWDVRTCRPSPPEFQMPRGAYNGFATDGNDPLLARRDSGRMAVFPLDGSPPWDIESGNYILPDARVHRDSKLLAVAARPGSGRAKDVADGAARVTVWDVATNRRVFATPADVKSPPVGVDFLPGGRLLEVTSARDDSRCEVRIWRLDSEAREPEARFVCPPEWGRLNHGAATPDGRHVVLASAVQAPASESLFVLPLAIDVSPPVFGAPVPCDVGFAAIKVDVARHGDCFAAACADDSARVYWLDGRLRWHLQGHGKRVERVRFSPSSKWVVTASLDGTARIWETATGEEWMVVEVGAPSPVWDAMFSEDEKVLYTVSLDGVVRGWLLDRERMRELAVVPGSR